MVGLESRLLLVAALDDFSVSAWSLARLLGLPLHAVYEMVGGAQKPSHLCLARLIKLYGLHTQGVNLARIHSINWDQGIIYGKRKVAPRPLSEIGIANKRLSHSR